MEHHVPAFITIIWMGITGTILAQPTPTPTPEPAAPQSRPYIDDGEIVAGSAGDGSQTSIRVGSSSRRRGDGDWYADPGAPLDARFYTHEATYAFDDTVTVRFRISRDAYVWIFSEDERGIVRQLFPNAYERNNVARGERTYRLPWRGNYRLSVGPPEGSRRLTLVALDANADNPVRTPLVWDRDDAFPRIRDLDRIIDEIEDAARRHARDARWNDPKLRSARYRPAPEDFYTVEKTRIYVSEFGDSHGGGGHRPRPTPEPPKPGQPAAELTVTSSPKGASVYLDGRYYGTTPLTVRVRPDRYELALQRSGYRRTVRTIGLENGSKESVNMRLERR